MLARVRPAASLGFMGCAIILALSATPAHAIQTTSAAPNLVCGVVVSVDTRVASENGAVLTDVQVVESASGGASTLTSFTMAGGEVGDTGMWSEQFTDLSAGDSVLAGVAEQDGGNTAVSAPIAGTSVPAATLPGLTSSASGISAGYIWDGLHWPDGSLPVRYYVNPSGLPAGATSAINAAAQTWEADSGSYMDFAYQGTTGASPSAADGVNVIGSGSLSSGTIALCTVWYYPSTKEITQFDIEYNTNYSFATDGAASAYDVEGIGVHELGHSLQLDDLYDAENSNQVMYGYGTTGDTSKRALGWGDVAGIRAIYPLAGGSTSTLSGYVTNSAGTPLAGVSVQVGGAGSGSTNASGYYSIAGITPGTYSVTYSLPGYTSATRSVDLSGDNTQSVTLSVPVVPVTRTLSGYVTNSAGTPLAGVSVQVGGAGSGSTNASGYYSIAGITPGTYSVTYSLPGYTSATRSVDLSGDNTQSVTLSVPVVPVTRTLSGYVTNSAGTPLAGVSVQVGGAGSGSTNASGYYSIAGITPGTYSVTYSLPGYTSATRSVDLSGDNTQSVTLSVPVVPVTLVTFSGTIRDGADSAPLQFAQVQVGTVATASTDASGQFSITGLPAGAYNVTYSLPGYTTSAAFETLTANKSVSTFLERIPVTFSGKVVNQDGSPVPGAVVDVGGVASGYTLASGQFSISGIPLGTHAVTYKHAGYVTRMTEMTFSSGPNTARDVTLQRVPPRLTLSAAAKSVRKNKSLKFSGSLSPQHTVGRAPVRIYRWRWVNSKIKWRSYPYVVGWTTDDGTRTSYTKSLAFKYAGRWRLIAKHSGDAEHPGSLQSKYVYVTVK